MIAKNKSLLGIVIGTAFLLSIPLVAMQFTTEVQWGLLDFIVAGTMLLSTGLIIAYISRKVRKTNLKILITMAALLVVLLLWIELAVGIFGTPLAGS